MVHPGGAGATAVNTLVRPFWLAGAFLMMMDGLTTYVALTLGTDEQVREGNPVAVHAIHTLGLPAMCALKGVIGVAMVWRLAAISVRGHRYAWMNRDLLFRVRPVWKVQRSAAWCLALTLVLMGVVVGNNLHAISLLVT